MIKLLIKLCIVLAIILVACYFTKPSAEAHKQEARQALTTYLQGQATGAIPQNIPLVTEVAGALAGTGSALAVEFIIKYQLKVDDTPFYSYSYIMVDDEPKTLTYGLLGFTFPAPSLKP